MQNNIKIVVASGKGGVGKSMLTSALANLFAENKKIIALDCDVDAPNLAVWLNEIKNWDKTEKISTSLKAIINKKKCNGCGICIEKCRFNALKIEKNRARVSPFLCEGCGICQIVCPQKAITLRKVKNGEIKTKKTKDGFILISGQLFPGEAGSGKIVSEIKERADKFDYDIMIIDSSPGTGCPVIASLRETNFVILVTEPTPSGFSDLKKVLEVVKYFKIPYSVVINKWDINKKLSQRIEIWSGNNFLGKISYDKEIFKAISRLMPIMETDLKAKEEIIKIYKNLTKKLFL